MAVKNYLELKQIKMNNKKIRPVLFWGIGLWLIGYILGILLFAIVPNYLLGWIIMPIGALITLWVLFKKIHVQSIRSFLFVGIIWAVIAIVFDYLFLVLLFKPTDGYYKLDVYLYYFLTLALPVVVGLIKIKKEKS